MKNFRPARFLLLIAALAVALSCSSLYAGCKEDKTSNQGVAVTAAAPFLLSGNGCFWYLPGVNSGSSYDAAALIGNTGTLSMWVSPDWNGCDDDINHYLFDLSSQDGKSIMPFWFWHWLRADIPTRSGKESLNSQIRKGVVKGDWLHIALIWNSNNSSSLYVNGEVTLNITSGTPDSGLLNAIELKRR